MPDNIKQSFDPIVESMFTSLDGEVAKGGKPEVLGTEKAYQSYVQKSTERGEMPESIEAFAPAYENQVKALYGQKGVLRRSSFYRPYAQAMGIEFRSASGTGTKDLGVNSDYAGEGETAFLTKEQIYDRKGDVEIQGNEQQVLGVMPISVLEDLNEMGTPLAMWKNEKGELAKYAVVPGMRSDGTYGWVGRDINDPTLKPKTMRSVKTQTIGDAYVDDFGQEAWNAAKDTTLGSVLAFAANFSGQNGAINEYYAGRQKLSQKAEEDTDFFSAKNMGMMTGMVTTQLAMGYLTGGLANGALAGTKAATIIPYVNRFIQGGLPIAQMIDKEMRDDGVDVKDRMALYTGALVLGTAFEIAASKALDKLTANKFSRVFGDGLTDYADSPFFTAEADGLLRRQIVAEGAENMNKLKALRTKIAQGAREEAVKNGESLTKVLERRAKDELEKIEVGASRLLDDTLESTRFSDVYGFRPAEVMMDANGVPQKVKYFAGFVDALKGNLTADTGKASLMANRFIYGALSEGKEEVFEDLAIESMKDTYNDFEYRGDKKKSSGNGLFAGHDPNYGIYGNLINNAPGLWHSFLGGAFMGGILGPARQMFNRNPIEHLRYSGSVNAVISGLSQKDYVNLAKEVFDEKNMYDNINDFQTGMFMTPELRQNGAKTEREVMAERRGDLYLNAKGAIESLGLAKFDEKGQLVARDLQQKIDALGTNDDFNYAAVASMTIRELREAEKTASTVEEREEIAQKIKDAQEHINKYKNGFSRVAREVRDSVNSDTRLQDMLSGNNTDYSTVTAESFTALVNEGSIVNTGFMTEEMFEDGKNIMNGMVTTVTGADYRTGNDFIDNIFDDQGNLIKSESITELTADNPKGLSPENAKLVMEINESRNAIADLGSQDITTADLTQLQVDTLAHTKKIRDKTKKLVEVISQTKTDSAKLKKANDAIAKLLTESGDMAISIFDQKNKKGVLNSNRNTRRFNSMFQEVPETEAEASAKKLIQQTVNNGAALASNGGQYDESTEYNLEKIAEVLVAESMGFTIDDPGAIEGFVKMNGVAQKIKNQVEFLKAHMEFDAAETMTIDDARKKIDTKVNTKKRVLDMQGQGKAMAIREKGEIAIYDVLFYDENGNPIIREDGSPKSNLLFTHVGGEPDPIVEVVFKREKVLINGRFLTPNTNTETGVKNYISFTPLPLSALANDLLDNLSTIGDKKFIVMAESLDQKNRTEGVTSLTENDFENLTDKNILLMEKRLVTVNALMRLAAKVKAGKVDLNVKVFNDFMGDDKVITELGALSKRPEFKDGATKGEILKMFGSLTNKEYGQISRVLYIALGNVKRIKKEFEDLTIEELVSSAENVERNTLGNMDQITGDKSKFDKATKDAVALIAEGLKQSNQTIRNNATLKDTERSSMIAKNSFDAEVKLAKLIGNLKPLADSIDQNVLFHNKMIRLYNGYDKTLMAMMDFANDADKPSWYEQLQAISQLANLAMNNGFETSDMSSILNSIGYLNAGPGVGKTTMINRMIDFLEANRKGNVKSYALNSNTTGAIKGSKANLDQTSPIPSFLEDIINDDAELKNTDGTVIIVDEFSAVGMGMTIIDGVNKNPISKTEVKENNLFIQDFIAKYKAAIGKDAKAQVFVDYQIKAFERAKDVSVGISLEKRLLAYYLSNNQNSRILFLGDANQSFPKPINFNGNIEALNAFDRAYRLSEINFNTKMYGTMVSPMRVSMRTGDRNMKKLNWFMGADDRSMKLEPQTVYTGNYNTNASREAFVLLNQNMKEATLEYSIDENNSLRGVKAIEKDITGADILGVSQNPNEVTLYFYNEVDMRAYIDKNKSDVALDDASGKIQVTNGKNTKLYEYRFLEPGPLTAQGTETEIGVVLATNDSIRQGLTNTYGANDITMNTAVSNVFVVAYSRAKKGLMMKSEVLGTKKIKSVFVTKFEDYSDKNVTSRSEAYFKFTGKEMENFYKLMVSAVIPTAPTAPTGNTQNNVTVPPPPGAGTGQNNQPNQPPVGNQPSVVAPKKRKRQSTQRNKKNAVNTVTSIFEEEIEMVDPDDDVVSDEVSNDTIGEDVLKSIFERAEQSNPGIEDIIIPQDKYLSDADYDRVVQDTRVFVLSASNGSIHELTGLDENGLTTGMFYMYSTKPVPSQIPATVLEEYSIQPYYKHVINDASLRQRILDGDFSFEPETVSRNKSGFYPKLNLAQNEDFLNTILELLNSDALYNTGIDLVEQYFTSKGNRDAVKNSNSLLNEDQRKERAKKYAEKLQNKINEVPSSFLEAWNSKYLNKPTNDESLKLILGLPQKYTFGYSVARRVIFNNSQTQTTAPSSTTAQNTINLYDFDRVKSGNEELQIGFSEEDRADIQRMIGGFLDSGKVRMENVDSLGDAFGNYSIGQEFDRIQVSFDSNGRTYKYTVHHEILHFLTNRILTPEALAEYLESYKGEVVEKILEGTLKSAVRGLNGGEVTIDDLSNQKILIELLHEGFEEYVDRRRKKQNARKERTTWFSKVAGFLYDMAERLFSLIDNKKYNRLYRDAYDGRYNDVNLFTGKNAYEEHGVYERKKKKALTNIETIFFNDKNTANEFSNAMARNVADYLPGGRFSSVEMDESKRYGNAIRQFHRKHIENVATMFRITFDSSISTSQLSNMVRVAANSKKMRYMHHDANGNFVEAKDRNGIYLELPFGSIGSEYKKAFDNIYNMPSFSAQRELMLADISRFIDMFDMAENLSRLQLTTNNSKSIAELYYMYELATNNDLMAEVLDKHFGSAIVNLSDILSDEAIEDETDFEEKARISGDGSVFGSHSFKSEIPFLSMPSMKIGPVNNYADYEGYLPITSEIVNKYPAFFKGKEGMMYFINGALIGNMPKSEETSRLIDDWNRMMVPGMIVTSFTPINRNDARKAMRSIMISISNEEENQKPSSIESELKKRTIDDFELLMDIDFNNRIELLNSSFSFFSNITTKGEFDAKKEELRKQYLSMYQLFLNVRSVTLVVPGISTDGKVSTLYLDGDKITPLKAGIATARDDMHEEPSERMLHYFMKNMDANSMTGNVDGVALNHTLEMTSEGLKLWYNEGNNSKVSFMITDKNGKVKMGEILNAYSKGFDYLNNLSHIYKKENAFTKFNKNQIRYTIEKAIALYKENPNANTLIEKVLQSQIDLVLADMIIVNTTPNEDIDDLMDTIVFGAGKNKKYSRYSKVLFENMLKGQNANRNLKTLLTSYDDYTSGNVLDDYLESLADLARSYYGSSEATERINGKSVPTQIQSSDSNKYNGALLRQRRKKIEEAKKTRKTALKKMGLPITSDAIPEVVENLTPDELVASFTTHGTGEMAVSVGVQNESKFVEWSDVKDPQSLNQSMLDVFAHSLFARGNKFMLMNPDFVDSNQRFIHLMEADRSNEGNFYRVPKSKKDMEMSQSFFTTTYLKDEASNTFNAAWLMQTKSINRIIGFLRTKGVDISPLSMDSESVVFLDDNIRTKESFNEVARKIKERQKLLENINELLKAYTKKDMTASVLLNVDVIAVGEEKTLKLGQMAAMQDSKLTDFPKDERQSIYSWYNLKKFALQRLLIDNTLQQMYVGDEKAQERQLKLYNDFVYGIDMSTAASGYFADFTSKDISDYQESVGIPSVWTKKEKGNNDIGFKIESIFSKHITSQMGYGNMNWKSKYLHRHLMARKDKKGIERYFVSDKENKKKTRRVSNLLSSYFILQSFVDAGHQFRVNRPYGSYDKATEAKYIHTSNTAKLRTFPLQGRLERFDNPLTMELKYVPETDEWTAVPKTTFYTLNTTSVRGFTTFVNGDSSKETSMSGDVSHQDGARTVPYFHYATQNEKTGKEYSPITKEFGAKKPLGDVNKSSDQTLSDDTSPMNIIMDRMMHEPFGPMEDRHTFHDLRQAMRGVSDEYGIMDSLREQYPELIQLFDDGGIHMDELGVRLHAIMIESRSPILIDGVPIDFAYAVIGNDEINKQKNRAHVDLADAMKEYAAGNGATQSGYLFELDIMTQGLINQSDRINAIGEDTAGVSRPRQQDNHIAGQQSSMYDAMVKALSSPVDKESNDILNSFAKAVKEIAKGKSTEAEYTAAKELLKALKKQVKGKLQSDGQDLGPFFYGMDRLFEQPSISQKVSQQIGALIEDLINPTSFGDVKVEGSSFGMFIDREMVNGLYVVKTSKTLTREQKEVAKEKGETAYSLDLYEQVENLPIFRLKDKQRTDSTSFKAMSVMADFGNGPVSLKLSGDDFLLLVSGAFSVPQGTFSNTQGGDALIAQLTEYFSLNLRDSASQELIRIKGLKDANGLSNEAVESMLVRNFNKEQLKHISAMMSMYEQGMYRSAIENNADIQITKADVAMANPLSELFDFDKNHQPEDIFTFYIKDQNGINGPGVNIMYNYWDGTRFIPTKNGTTHQQRMETLKYLASVNTFNLHTDHRSDSSKPSKRISDDDRKRFLSNMGMDKNTKGFDSLMEIAMLSKVMDITGTRTPSEGGKSGFVGTIVQFTNGVGSMIYSNMDRALLDGHDLDIDRSTVTHLTVFKDNDNKMDIDVNTLFEGLEDADGNVYEVTPQNQITHERFKFYADPENLPNIAQSIDEASKPYKENGEAAGKKILANHSKIDGIYKALISSGAVTGKPTVGPQANFMKLANMVICSLREIPDLANNPLAKGMFKQFAEVIQREKDINLEMAEAIKNAGKDEAKISKARKDARRERTKNKELMNRILGENSIFITLAVDEIKLKWFSSHNIGIEMSSMLNALIMNKELFINQLADNEIITKEQKADFMSNTSNFVNYYVETKEFKSLARRFNRMNDKYQGKDASLLNVAYKAIEKLTSDERKDVITNKKEKLLADISLIIDTFEKDINDKTIEELMFPYSNRHKTDYAKIRAALMEKVKEVNKAIIDGEEYGELVKEMYAIFYELNAFLKKNGKAYDIIMYSSIKREVDDIASSVEESDEDDEDNDYVDSSISNSIDLIESNVTELTKEDKFMSIYEEVDAYIKMAEERAGQQTGQLMLEVQAAIAKYRKTQGDKFRKDLDRLTSPDRVEQNMEAAKSLEEELEALFGKSLANVIDAREEIVKGTDMEAVDYLSKMIEGLASLRVSNTVRKQVAANDKSVINKMYAITKMVEQLEPENAVMAWQLYKMSILSELMLEANNITSLNMYRPSSHVDVIEKIRNIENTVGMPWQKILELVNSDKPVIPTHNERMAFWREERMKFTLMEEKSNWKDAKAKMIQVGKEKQNLQYFDNKYGISTDNGITTEGNELDSLHLLLNNRELKDYINKLNIHLVSNQNTALARSEMVHDAMNRLMKDLGRDRFSSTVYNTLFDVAGKMVANEYIMERISYRYSETSIWSKYMKDFLYAQEMNSQGTTIADFKKEFLRYDFSNERDLLSLTNLMARALNQMKEDLMYNDYEYNGSTFNKFADGRIKKALSENFFLRNVYLQSNDGGMPFMRVLNDESMDNPNYVTNMKNAIQALPPDMQKLLADYSFMIDKVSPKTGNFAMYLPSSLMSEYLDYTKEKYENALRSETDKVTMTNMFYDSFMAFAALDPSEFPIRGKKSNVMFVDGLATDKTISEYEKRREFIEYFNKQTEETERKPTGKSMLFKVEQRKEGEERIPVKGLTNDDLSFRVVLDVDSVYEELDARYKAMWKVIEGKINATNNPLIIQNRKRIQIEFDAKVEEMKKKHYGVVLNGKNISVKKLNNNIDIKSKNDLFTDFVDELDKEFNKPSIMAYIAPYPVKMTVSFEGGKVTLVSEFREELVLSQKSKKVTPKMEKKDKKGKVLDTVAFLPSDALSMLLDVEPNDQAQDNRREEMGSSLSDNAVAKLKSFAKNIEEENGGRIVISEVEGMSQGTFEQVMELLRVHVGTNRLAHTDDVVGVGLNVKYTSPMMKQRNSLFASYRSWENFEAGSNLNWAVAIPNRKGTTFKIGDDRYITSGTTMNPLSISSMLLYKMTGTIPVPMNNGAFDLNEFLSENSKIMVMRENNRKQELVKDIFNPSLTTFIFDKDGNLHVFKKVSGHPIDLDERTEYYFKNHKSIFTFNSINNGKEFLYEHPVLVKYPKRGKALFENYDKINAGGYDVVPIDSDKGKVNNGYFAMRAKSNNILDFEKNRVLSLALENQDEMRIANKEIERMFNELNNSVDAEGKKWMTVNESQTGDSSLRIDQKNGLTISISKVGTLAGMFHELSHLFFFSALVKNHNANNLFSADSTKAKIKKIKDLLAGTSYDSYLKSKMFGYEKKYDEAKKKALLDIEDEDHRRDLIELDELYNQILTDMLFKKASFYENGEIPQNIKSLFEEMKALSQIVYGDSFVNQDGGISHNSLVDMISDLNGVIVNEVEFVQQQVELLSGEKGKEIASQLKKVKSSYVRHFLSSPGQTSFDDIKKMAYGDVTMSILSPLKQSAFSIESEIRANGAFDKVMTLALSNGRSITMAPDAFNRLNSNGVNILKSRNEIIQALISMYNTNPEIKSAIDEFEVKKKQRVGKLSTFLSNLSKESFDQPSKLAKSFVENLGLAGITDDNTKDKNDIIYSELADNIALQLQQVGYNKAIDKIMNYEQYKAHMAGKGILIDMSIEPNVMFIVHNVKRQKDEPSSVSVITITDEMLSNNPLSRNSFTAKITETNIQDATDGITIRNDIGTLASLNSMLILDELQRKHNVIPGMSSAMFVSGGVDSPVSSFSVPLGTMSSNISTARDMGFFEGIDNDLRARLNFIADKQFNIREYLIQALEIHVNYYTESGKIKEEQSRFYTLLKEMKTNPDAMSIVDVHRLAKEMALDYVSRIYENNKRNTEQFKNAFFRNKLAMKLIEIYLTDDFKETIDAISKHEKGIGFIEELFSYTDRIDSPMIQLLVDYQKVATMAVKNQMEEEVKKTNRATEKYFKDAMAHLRLSSFGVMSMTNDLMGPLFKKRMVHKMVNGSVTPEMVEVNINELHWDMNDPETQQAITDGKISKEMVEYGKFVIDRIHDNLTKGVGETGIENYKKGQLPYMKQTSEESLAKIGKDGGFMESMRTTIDEALGFDIMGLYDEGTQRNHPLEKLKAQDPFLRQFLDRGGMGRNDKMGLQMATLPDGTTGLVLVDEAINRVSTTNLQLLTTTSTMLSVRRDIMDRFVFGPEHLMRIGIFQAGRGGQKEMQNIMRIMDDNVRNFVFGTIKTLGETVNPNNPNRMISIDRGMAMFQTMMQSSVMGLNLEMAGRNAVSGFARIVMNAVQQSATNSDSNQWLNRYNQADVVKAFSLMGTTAGREKAYILAKKFGVILGEEIDLVKSHELNTTFDVWSNKEKASTFQRKSDQYLRMTVMVSQMINDGSWEAYDAYDKTIGDEIVPVIEYDITKDRLFYDADGNMLAGAKDMIAMIKGKVTAEAGFAYDSNGNKKEQSDSDTLVLGHDVRRIARYRTMGDQAMAMTNQSAVKSAIMQHTAGRALMQLGSFMLEYANKWYAGKREIGTMGAYGYVDGKADFMKWEHEGYFQSLVQIADVMWKSKTNPSDIWGKMSTIQKRNLKSFGIDAIIISTIYALYAALSGDDEDDKEKIEQAKKEARKKKTDVYLQHGKVDRNGNYRPILKNQFQKHLFENIFVKGFQEQTISVDPTQLKRLFDPEVPSFSLFEKSYRMATNILYFPEWGNKEVWMGVGKDLTSLVPYNKPFTQMTEMSYFAYLAMDGENYKSIDMEEQDRRKAMTTKERMAEDEAKERAKNSINPFD